jgi:uncharacterized oxidoreductase
MKLEDKTILITGGGSGIGLELARRLADANQVIIAGRSTTRLRAVHETDPRLRPVPLDVTSEASASSVINWLSDEYGGLDMLINNAGFMSDGDLNAPHAEVSIASELAVNLEGAIRMTRLALPLLRAAREAGVVFMSSGLAIAAVPEHAVYAAAKAGIHSFARSLRADSTGTTTLVFEVLPPAVDTDLASDLAVSKIAPSAVADAVIRGMRRDKQQIAVARIRPLMIIARISPRTADALIQRALRPSLPATNGEMRAHVPPRTA